MKINISIWQSLVFVLICLLFTSCKKGNDESLEADSPEITEETEVQSGGFFTHAPKKLVVKGFSVDMPAQSCIDLINSKYYKAFFRDKQIFQYKGQQYSEVTYGEENGVGKIIVPDGVFANVDTSTGRITKFYFSNALINNLFNASDMNTEQFANEFMQSYKIPELTPIDKNVADKSLFFDMAEMTEGLAFSSKTGYRVVIFKITTATQWGTNTEKRMTITSIPKVSERKFD